MVLSERLESRAASSKLTFPKPFGSLNGWMIYEEIQKLETRDTSNDVEESQGEARFEILIQFYLGTPGHSRTWAK